MTRWELTSWKLKKIYVRIFSYALTTDKLEIVVSSKFYVPILILPKIPVKSLVDDGLYSEYFYQDWIPKFEAPGYLYSRFPPSLVGGDFKRYVAFNFGGI